MMGAPPPPLKSAPRDRRCLCWKSHFLFTQENCSSVPFVRHLLLEQGGGGVGRPWWVGGRAGDAMGVLQEVSGGAGSP